MRLVTDTNTLVSGFGWQERLTVVADDPDNRVLEAATAGQADAIVTGDHELLALHTFRGLPILTAADFLSHLADTP